MKADHFSLKARRTTRIPLRIPVLLVVEESGKTVTLDGWTMIVNVHGAKIESKRRFEVSEEVTVQVPFNGMSQKGKVVWSKPEPNKNRNHEFGVELDCPDNLWGVGFPPSDWKSKQEEGAGAASDAVLDMAPAGAIHSSGPEPPGETSPSDQPDGPLQDQEEFAMQNEVETSTEQSSAETPPVQLLDLSEMIPVQDPEQESEQDSSPVQECTIELSELEFPPAAESLAAPQAEAPAASDPVPDALAQPIAGEAAQTEASPPAPEPLPAPSPEDSIQVRVPGSHTDKLSAFFSELVDSALESKLNRLIAGVGKRIEDRAAQVENCTLDRIEEQIQSAVKSHTEAMEQRASEYVASQRKSLEEKVNTHVAEAAEATRQRQQEQAETTTQAVGKEMEELLQKHRQRLDEHVADLVTTSQQGLRSSMEQQLPGIEKDLLERCRVEGERMMSAQLEQWTLLFSDRLRNSQQSLEQQMNAAAKEASSRHQERLGGQMEETLQQAGARLEQQLERIGTQVRQKFLRHIVTELGRSQEVWIQQAQRQLEKMAAENLDRNRRNLSQYMKSFGEFLIQQATAGEQAPSEPVASPDSQEKVNSAEGETEISSRMES